jgi:hypothetical protein
MHNSAPTCSFPLRTFPSSSYVQDAGVGRAALRSCWDKLPQYTECAEKHLTAKQRSTWSAPDFYVKGEKQ